MKLLGRTSGFALGALKRVTGVDLLTDLSTFFRLLGGLLEGFRARAEQVETLLRDPRTRFLLVTSPEREPIDEAIYFHRKLKAARMSFGGGIVNRVHADRLGDADAGRADRAAGRRGRPLEGARDAGRRVLRRRARARAARPRERRPPRRSGWAPSVPLLLVPHLDDDVHDAGGLVAVGAHLFALTAQLPRRKRRRRRARSSATARLGASRARLPHRLEARHQRLVDGDRRRRPPAAHPGADAQQEGDGAADHDRQRQRDAEVCRARRRRSRPRAPRPRTARPPGRSSAGGRSARRAACRRRSS